MLCACGLAQAQAAEHLSFLDPQGAIADAQRDHFWLVVALLLVLVAGPVFVGTIWIAWRYRYGATGSAYKPKWMFYKPLEYLTWGGPVVIVVFLTFLVWHNTERFDPYRAIASSAPTTHVQVVGYDWKWLFIYPDQGIATVGELVFPAGRPLSLELTSGTVMQSFFIPALGSQIYAMGGMVTRLNLEASKPGNFLGENTMYNGDGFHGQKFDARAVPANQFNAWVKQVRAGGVPLDAAALKVVTAPGTKAQLRAALPQAATPGGAFHFTGVKSGLFKDVVMATMHDQPLAPVALVSSTSGSPQP